MGFMDTVKNSVKRELKDSSTRPTHYAIVHASYKKRKNEVPGAPGFNELSDKEEKKVEFKVPFKDNGKESIIATNKAKAFIKSHPDHKTLNNAGYHLSSVEHKKSIAIKEHQEEVQAVIAEIEQNTNIINFPVKENLEGTKMDSSRPVGVILSFIRPNDAEGIDEGKWNWDKANKSHLTDTQHNRMLYKKSYNTGGPSKKALSVLAAKAKAVGKGGKVEEELKGNQHRIDANKNGKVDAHDFKILRGETKAKTKPQYDKERPAFKEEVEHVEEGGMPASIIKHKQNISYLSDKEFANKYANRSDDELRSMAWRHGYGGPGKPGHEHYVNRRKKGLKEEVEQVYEISAKTAMSASIKATKEIGTGKSSREDKLLSLSKMADEKYRKMQGKSSSAKVATTEEVMDEALGSMANIKKSAKDAYERSKDKNTKPGDAPAWLKQAIKDKAKKAVQKEETDFNEGVEVDKKNYSWGKMITVHHGASHSYPLHPEHQKKIADLKDGEKTTFKDETKTNVTAHRDGDTIHLSADTHGSTKTPVARHHFTEEKESLEDWTKRHKKAGHEIKKDNKTATYHAWSKDNKHMGAYRATHKISESDLEEARRGRPRKDGSKPSGDEEGGREHIIVQLRKAENLRGERHTEFNDNSKHKLPLSHVKKALDMHSKMKPQQKGEFEARLAKSHQSFHDAISGKPAEPAKPKITLAKSVREGVDPSTHRADKGPIAVRTIRKPDGSYVLSKTKTGTSKTADLIDAKESVDKFAKQYIDTEEREEEKREGQKAPKGASADLTADSAKRYEKDPLFSKIKMKLPPTVGNSSAGGEDTEYVSGKYSVAEEKILNSLYDKLDENNKEIFNSLIQTEEGVAQLVEFAMEQGI